MISDPWFYAVALPAVLLIGISKSGFGAGFGALAVPLMALAVPVPQAAAILLPLLLVVDILGLAALMKHRDRALLRLLMPAGLLGIVIGALLFGVFSAKMVAGLVGALTLIFLAIRVLWPSRADAPPAPRWLGFLLGTVSGFTSFVAHAGSPPIGFYVTPLKLPLLVFSGTMGVFFAAINLAKWPPYAWLGLIDSRNMLTSPVLVPLAPLGVWLGLRLVKRISPELFYQLFRLGMLLTGLRLLWDGFGQRLRKSANTASPPHRPQRRIERLARPHHRLDLVVIRQVISTNISGLALHRRKLRHDGLFAGLQRFGQRRKVALQRFIFGLLGQRLCPVQGQIELAAAVVQLAGLGRRVLVVVQQFAGGDIERLGQYLGLCISGLQPQIFERYRQRQKLTQ